MTTTTTETLSVNGVVLNTLAKNIESLTGRLRMAALRTENITVPGRHGTIRTPNKRYEEGTIVLPMWVRGTDDDGAIPTTTRQQFIANVDALTQLFRPGAGLLTVIHTLPDATQRQVLAECTEAIDFSVLGGGNPLGKFSVSLKVPSVFWQDVSASSLSLSLTLDGDLTGLAGTTAPIDDSSWVITGPFTYLKVEAKYNGSSLDDPMYFEYTGTVTTGQTLTINCDTWKLTGAGGLVVDYSKLYHTGGARWLTLVAGPVGTPPEAKLTLTGSIGGTTTVTLNARRKFLVG